MNQGQYEGLSEEVKLKERVWNKLVLKDVWRRQIKKKNMEKNTETNSEKDKEKEKEYMKEY